MEVFDFATWMAAAAALTAPVMVVCQWLKQYTWWRNGWSITAAPIIGIILVASAMWAAGTFGWDGSQVVIHNPLDFYKALVQGIFGGAAAPIGYNLQKGLPDPVRPFKPGPLNNSSDLAEAQRSGAANGAA